MESVIFELTNNFISIFVQDQILNKETFDLFLNLLETSNEITSSYNIPLQKHLIEHVYTVVK